MPGGSGGKKSAKTYWFSHEWVFHEVDVPDGAGKKSAEGQKYCDTVWPERVAAGHGMSYEGRPEAHQDSRNDADCNAFSGDCATSADQAAVGFAVHDYGDHGADDSHGEECRIAFGLNDVT